MYLPNSKIQAQVQIQSCLYYLLCTSPQQGSTLQLDNARAVQKRKSIVQLKASRQIGFYFIQDCCVKENYFSIMMYRDAVHAN